jgi:hypothetical protein
MERNIIESFGFKISNFKIDSESQEYEACTFNLDGKYIVARTAKQTPKKIGQFVTLWKRNRSKTISPYSVTDEFDFLLIQVFSANRTGLFLFPKSELALQGILSDKKQKGKLGFRVYPDWDFPQNKQAERTKRWMSVYFLEVKLEESKDFEKTKRFLKEKVGIL